MSISLFRQLWGDCLKGWSFRREVRLLTKPKKKKIVKLHNLFGNGLDSTEVEQPDWRIRKISRGLKSEKIQKHRPNVETKRSVRLEYSLQRREAGQYSLKPRRNLVLNIWTIVLGEKKIMEGEVGEHTALHEPLKSPTDRRGSRKGLASQPSYKRMKQSFFLSLFFLLLIFLFSPPISSAMDEKDNQQQFGFCKINLETVPREVAIL